MKETILEKKSFDTQSTANVPLLPTSTKKFKFFSIKPIKIPKKLEYSMY